MRLRDQLPALHDAILRLAAAHGAEDVRVLAPPAVNLLEVRPRPLDAARVGLTSQEILDAVTAVRAGVDVGMTWDGPHS